MERAYTGQRLPQQHIFMLSMHALHSIASLQTSLSLSCFHSDNSLVKVRLWPRFLARDLQKAAPGIISAGFCVKTVLGLSLVRVDQTLLDPATSPYDTVRAFSVMKPTNPGAMGLKIKHARLTDVNLPDKQHLLCLEITSDNVLSQIRHALFDNVCVL